MPIYDALFHFEDKITHILTRHEQGAIHAAEGYGKSNQKTGSSVCYIRTGSHQSHHRTGRCVDGFDTLGLHNRSGFCPSMLGSDAFQEVDVIACSNAVTKWNFQVTSASEISDAIAKAFYVANSGRPGPVLIDITKNAQVEHSYFDYNKKPIVRSYHPKPSIQQANIEEAAELINQAKKPLILAGHGIHIAHAQEIFKSFVEKSGIPSASTVHGLSALPSDHKLNKGMLGMHGNLAPNMLTNSCDLSHSYWYAF
jgi:acetolactate synthase-1/2/3 large subunit